MAEAVLAEAASSPGVSTRVIRLWTPKNIFWLAVFLGWPTALVLCVINWFRLGRWKKALMVAAGGLVLLTLYLYAGYKLSGSAAASHLMILDILLVCFLQAMMSTDFIGRHYFNPGYRQASIGWGILIGILTWVVIFCGAFFIFMFTSLMKLIF